MHVPGEKGAIRGSLGVADLTASSCVVCGLADQRRRQREHYVQQGQHWPDLEEF